MFSIFCPVLSQGVCVSSPMPHTGHKTAKPSQQQVFASASMPCHAHAHAKPQNAWPKMPGKLEKQRSQAHQPALLPMGWVTRSPKCQMPKMPACPTIIIMEGEGGGMEGSGHIATGNQQTEQTLHAHLHHHSTTTTTTGHHPPFTSPNAQSLPPDPKPK